MTEQERLEEYIKSFTKDEKSHEELKKGLGDEGLKRITSLMKIFDDKFKETSQQIVEDLSKQITSISRDINDRIYVLTSRILALNSALYYVEGMLEQAGLLPDEETRKKEVEKILRKDMKEVQDYMEKQKEQNDVSKETKGACSQNDISSE